VFDLLRQTLTGYSLEMDRLGVYKDFAQEMGDGRTCFGLSQRQGRRMKGIGSFVNGDEIFILDRMATGTYYKAGRSCKTCGLGTEARSTSMGEERVTVRIKNRVPNTSFSKKRRRARNPRSSNAGGGEDWIENASGERAQNASSNNGGKGITEKAINWGRNCAETRRRLGVSSPKPSCSSK